MVSVCGCDSVYQQTPRTLLFLPFPKELRKRKRNAFSAARIGYRVSAWGSATDRSSGFYWTPLFSLFFLLFFRATMTPTSHLSNAHFFRSRRPHNSQFPFNHSTDITVQRTRNRGSHLKNAEDKPYRAAWIIRLLQYPLPGMSAEQTVPFWQTISVYKSFAHICLWLSGMMMSLQLEISVWGIYLFILILTIRGVRCSK